VYTAILYQGAAFTNVNPSGYQASLTDQSIGVDCSGFIQRVASYNENNYAIRDIKWDGADTENRLLWGHYDPGIKISIDTLPNHTTADASFYDGSWPVFDATTRVGDINLIIPGDIITLNGHITLVCRVEYNDQSIRTLAMDNIFVIEADSPYDQWQVIMEDSRNLSYFSEKQWFTDDYRDVEVRRLITN
jgi:hypothetical protein